jgi:hypothetical protein
MAERTNVMLNISNRINARRREAGGNMIQKIKIFLFCYINPEKTKTNNSFHYLKKYHKQSKIQN